MSPSPRGGTSANGKAAAKPRKPRAAPVVRSDPPPLPPKEERDYLVIFEEPDPYGLPADDVLVLDIEAPGARTRPEVDVQQKVKLELTNTTSRLGTFGYATALLGGLIGAILMVVFAAIYPQDWYGSASVGTVRALILLAVLAVALMIAGTVLTHYGRRIQARSELSDVRIVEKAPQSKAQFE